MKKIILILVSLLALVGFAFGQDMIMANMGEPTLDPSLLTDTISTNVGLGLFEGLMQYDPKTGKGVPALSDGVPTVSKDGLTVTAKIRKASWSDGTPVTADDFVFAMKRILDPATASDYAYMPAAILKGGEDFNGGKTTDFSTVGIKAKDKQTVVYTLANPAPYFIDVLTHNTFWPLPKWSVEKHGSDWTKPGNIVTNGPYVLKEWKPQDYILLEKSTKYWDAKNVKIKSIKLLANDNDGTAYSMFKNGEVDWMHGISTSQIDEIKLRKDYQASAQLGTYYYCFNVTAKPLDNVLVRKALAAAIDKKTLVDKVTKGGQIPTDSWVPPMAGYTPAKGQSFNVEQAKKFLAQAGYADGKGFPEMSIIYNTSSGHKAIAEYIQQQWKNNLGIDVTLNNMEFKTFLDLRSNHEFEIARHGWIADYMDASNFTEIFVTDAGNNDAAYSNPAYDKLVEQARTASGDARLKLMQQAEKVFLTDDQVMIPIYYYANQDLIDTSKWGGWYSNPTGFHPWKSMFKK